MRRAYLIFCAFIFGLNAALEFVAPAPAWLVACLWLLICANQFAMWRDKP